MYINISTLIQILKKGFYKKELSKAGEGLPFYKADRASCVPLNQQNFLVNDHENVIEFIDVPITAPNADVLIDEISLKIDQNMNVIVTGPNGCGKSSLFRVLGGLWPIFKGRLRCPSHEKIFYIPQKPYLPPGTLRDQVIYPHSREQQVQHFLDKMAIEQPEFKFGSPQELRDAADNDLLQILATLGIDYLVTGRENRTINTENQDQVQQKLKEIGWDAERVWRDVFSGGEKQRIAIARLFYHQPAFAIMDECTSAVSKEHEPIVYANAKKRKIALFTVSHRPNDLAKYHDYILKIENRSYQFTPIVHE